MRITHLENAKKILYLYQKKAKNHFGFDAKIELQIDLKGHRLIGQCQKIGLSHYKIRLHQELIERYGLVYLNDVVAHELAHAIVMEQCKGRVKPHGNEFKSVLFILEDGYIAPKQRPKYEIKAKSRKMRQFNYGCQCKNRIHKLSAIRHNRIKRGVYNYTCKYCNGVLYEIPSISK